MKTILLLSVSFTALVASQSLIDATQPYAQLSSFRNLLELNPTLNPPPNAPQLTVLIPSDQAFSDYLTATGNTVDTLPLSTLTSIFKYHTLANELSSADFKRNGEILEPTHLTDDVYNHRNGTQGQVVIISSKTASGSNTTKVTVRQAPPQASQSVLSGGGETVGMQLVDGAWSGGVFQIVDGFLTLPKTCTGTMATNPQGLTSLSGALSRTNLTDVLNNFANVTCLAPTNLAFSSAGSPDTSIAIPLLADALKFHTIAGAQYSLGLVNGEMLQGLNGAQIRIRIDADGQVWFNDAKVLQANVITNNGVIHVLDKIMSPLNSTDISSSYSPSSPTSSQVPSGSATASGAATTTSTGPSTVTTSGSTSSKLLGHPGSLAASVLALAAAIACSAMI